jgi:endogenous inhibitor of DNA gyrase (YacG/DUF329 family)
MNNTIKCPHCNKVFFDLKNDNICPFCKRKIIDIPDFLKDIFNIGDK